MIQTSRDSLPSRMSSEVESIVAVLAAPVNSWLNGEQQLQFARLAAIARRAEKTESELRELQAAIKQEREAFGKMKAEAEDFKRSVEENCCEYRAHELRELNERDKMDVRG